MGALVGDCEENRKGGGGVSLAGVAMLGLLYWDQSCVVLSSVGIDCALFRLGPST